MADNRDDGVNFLYRAMVERDPQKRRVKPVESHMLQLNFGDLDDSSDDSDFKVPDREDDDDSNSEDSDDDGADDDDDDQDEEDEAPSEVEQEETSSEGSENRKKSNVSVGELIEQARIKQAQARQRIAAEGTKSSQFRFLICSVCLGDISEEDDEIVECDGCGVSVHEGCYGIQDSDSVVSTVSSSSTEPWFCDACKGGRVNPVCELCPNLGGIFKETDVGKWVHLVCALYIPGVAFGDVDKLSPVTLFEMPYSKWGSKPCAFCEDERFSRSGVCISCDAGMCRNYFHVTCAQREGLLSEALPEEEIADPFFAYCKLHADKMIIRSKRRNWLALQSQIKQYKERSNLQPEEKSRIERKLQHHRDKYQAVSVTRSPPWVPTQKMPRLLTSSPSACRRLIKKAELLGINTQALHVQPSASDNVVDIRRKWHVPPSFSVEFVSYYLDRNERMVSMQKRLDELLAQNSKLQEEEQTLRHEFEKLTSENEKLKQTNTELRECGMQLWKFLNNLGLRKFLLPEVFKQKKPVKTLSRQGRRSDSDTSVTLNQCGICKKTQDQHLLAKCDTCQLYYHLGCLDPPLSRMPKKTKQQGWQCSECDKTDNDEKEEEVDPDAPRKLREHIKEPIKFTPPSISPTLKKNAKFKFRKRSLENRRFLKRRLEDGSIENGEEDSCLPTPEKNEKLVKEKEPPKPESEIPLQQPPKKVAKQVNKVKNTKEVLATTCSKCNSPGDITNLVSCDECNNSFHFHCLNPPVKKSPKQRGYAWHCDSCDPTEDEAEDQQGDKPPSSKKKKK